MEISGLRGSATARFYSVHGTPSVLASGLPVTVGRWCQLVILGCVGQRALLCRDSE